MFTSFSEFKFFQSFRIPVEKGDDLRMLCERDDERGNSIEVQTNGLVDISVTGLGFLSYERIKVGEHLKLTLFLKKEKIELAGKVVRVFGDGVKSLQMIYGIELEEDKAMRKFLEHYVLAFSHERLKDCLIDAALKERYTKPTDGFEMFSLLLSLFKDITHFGDKEGFMHNLLDEVIRILNAQRASIFLINPETNELEAVSALGMEKNILKFDYRKGVAGSVFTTGIALNIDTANENGRFNQEFDEKSGFKTTSIICHPIHNREDKIVGVIEVLNKKNQDRFTVEDEKTMKVLSLVFSSVFHSFNPISDMSLIRRFSNPFDRQFAYIGRTGATQELRATIIKIKDLDAPVLIDGEMGVGKSLFARIIHHEGNRGLHPFGIVECSQDCARVERELFGENSALQKSQKGSVVFREINHLSMDIQEKLYQVLQDRRIPGSAYTLDCRILVTSTCDLGKMAHEGSFHRELYLSLSKAYVHITPLRNRVEDIEELAFYFLKIECKKAGLLLKSFHAKMLKKMKHYDWPGNVQELATFVERAVLYNPKGHVICETNWDSNVVPLVDMESKKRTFGEIDHVADFDVPLKDRLALVERQMILDEIKRHNGNKSHAAKSMGISREALRKKLMISEEVKESIDHEMDDDLQTSHKKAA